MSDEHDNDDEWISLQDASALLGVAASTLRRWGDAGKLPMKRTLGGHRRFARGAVARLAERGMALTVAPPAPPAVRPGWGLDERELTRQQWHARLAARSDAGRMRGLGQRVLGLLMQHVSRPADDTRYLDEARAVGELYGREARAAGVSMQETAEAFLFFRRSFSQLAMPLPGLAHAPDLSDAADLHGRIDQFMDAILLGTIAGFEADDAERR
jgi:excisionase family DNA binding protein